MERDVSRSIHRLSLKIKPTYLETEYRSASMAEGIRQFRFAFIMGIVFYLLFIIVDGTTYPDVKDVFFRVRLLLVVPVLLMSLLATTMKFYHLHARPINLFAVMIAGLGIILMAAFGASSEHISGIYGGMFLVMFLLYSFFKMSYLDAFFVGTALLLGYLTVEYVLIQPPMSVFVTHVFYLTSTNIIGTSVAYLMEYQSKKEFLLKKKLSESVIKDALTGLYNRHYFDQFLVTDIEEFISRSRGVKHFERRLGDMKTAKYGLYMIDIDFFKRINDTFGHHSGDLVLQQFAAVLEENVRRTDDVLRVGGEEFLLVLKLTTDEYLVRFLKTIGQTIANHDFRIEGGGIIGCTASIGLVVVPNTRTDDVGELVRYADRALYRSKDTGRNRGHRVYELQGEVEYEEILWDE